MTAARAPNRIRAALAPLATTLLGAAALLGGNRDYHRTIGQAYALEMFITSLSFPLIVFRRRDS